MNLGKRNCGVIYYDCTNFFFEIDEDDEGGLRKYGKSKENRPLPLVEMELFVDYDGIPLAMSIHPGNTNEQITLKPLEKKILNDYNMSQFVVCADAGLASKANRKFNDINNRAFIVTQSIKKLNTSLKDWALDKKGWKRYGQKDNFVYSISNINKETDYDTVYFKERWVDRGSFEEKIIVTFSLKYQEYQQNIRNSQLERAVQSINSGSAKRSTKNQNDYRRFIEKTSTTDSGELPTKDNYTLNYSKIEEEARYDGFYAVATNLEDKACDIIKINRQRWKIEECFRIMKTEFKSRPVYVQRESRIKAHFITCYLALVIYRYLEKRLNCEYTCEQILETLQDMNIREMTCEGFIPTYTRTNLTDTLHDKFGFRTDYQLITKKEMKKYCLCQKNKKDALFCIICTSQKCAYIRTFRVFLLCKVSNSGLYYNRKLRICQ